MVLRIETKDKAIAAEMVEGPLRYIFEIFQGEQRLAVVNCREAILGRDMVGLISQGLCCLGAQRSVFCTLGKIVQRYSYLPYASARLSRPQSQELCVDAVYSLWIGMGKQQSKEKKKGEEEEETKINDKRMIFIDEFGNFIVGKSVKDIIALNTLDRGQAL